MTDSFRYLRVALFAVFIILAISGLIFWSWSNTASHINSARSIGVFSSPSEGMRSLVDSGWIGVEETKIVRGCLKPHWEAAPTFGSSLPVFGQKHGLTAHHLGLILTTSITQEATL